MPRNSLARFFKSSAHSSKLFKIRKRGPAVMDPHFIANAVSYEFDVSTSNADFHTGKAVVTPSFNL